MAQNQIDLFKEAYSCDYDQFTTDLLKRKAEYIIDEKTKIVIKKGRSGRNKTTRIHLVVSGKKVEIEKDTWKKLCNLKESVLFLLSFIEDH